MPIENAELLGAALEFLVSHIAGKGLDKLIDGNNHSQDEKSIAEHVYLLLTESLEEFCKKYNIEFDEHAIRDTFLDPNQRIGKLKCEEQLRIILEEATGLELSTEELAVWATIVGEHIVSDKHQKLFRAIQLKEIKGNTESLSDPDWMRKYLSDNFAEVVFEKVQLDDFLGNIRTCLSKVCWMQTQDLLMELALNAFSHGAAEHLWLRIGEREISLVDDGNPFDTMLLTVESSKLSGGNWTITRYAEIYPEVNISYLWNDNKNETTIRFEEKVFSVNRLCEITLPKKMILAKTDIKLRYPDCFARYYYVDCSNFKPERSFLCMSGAATLLRELTDFCLLRHAEVYLYMPYNSEIWDDFIEKINVCVDYCYQTDRIHIIRG